MVSVRGTALVLSLLLSIQARAESSLPDEFVSAQPRVQLYMAYAQFKMANYAQAEAMWRYIGGPAKGEAAFNLGILYQQGLGVAADIEQAVRFYRQGADAGSRAAAYQLGLIHLNHPDFLDQPQAQHWLSIAALDGDTDAAALLRQLNDPKASDEPLSQVRTLLVQGETEQALEQLQRMTRAEPPNYQAVTRLAWLYETGIGVPRDINRAATLFRQAAEAGVAEAQYALAVMLQTGVGQPRDRVAADRWLRQAAAQGYPQALQKLEASQ